MKLEALHRVGVADSGLRDIARVLIPVDIAVFTRPALGGVPRLTHTTMQDAPEPVQAALVPDPVHVETDGRLLLTYGGRHDGGAWRIRHFGPRTLISLFRRIDLAPHDTLEPRLPLTRMPAFLSVTHTTVPRTAWGADAPYLFECISAWAAGLDHPAPGDGYYALRLTCDPRAAYDWKRSPPKAFQKAVFSSAGTPTAAVLDYLLRTSCLERMSDTIASGFVRRQPGCNIHLVDRRNVDHMSAARICFPNKSDWALRSWIGGDAVTARREKGGSGAPWEMLACEIELNRVWGDKAAGQSVATSYRSLLRDAITRPFMTMLDHFRVASWLEFAPQYLGEIFQNTHERELQWRLLGLVRYLHSTEWDVYARLTDRMRLPCTQRDASWDHAVQTDAATACLGGLRKAQRLWHAPSAAPMMDKAGRALA